MSRTCDHATAKYLEHAAAALTTPPITLACTFRSTDATRDQGLVSICTSASGNHRFTLAAMGATAGDPIVAVTRSTSSGTASTSTGFSANTWHRALAVFAGPNDRRVYIDAGSKGTDATPITPSTPNLMRVGAALGGAALDGLTGDIAEAAIWDVALTDADAAAHGTGLSPLLIRPANLVAYWKILGRDDPEPDIIGRFDLALVASPAYADHPRVIYPARRKLVHVPAAAVAGGPPLGSLALLGVGR